MLVNQKHRPVETPPPRRCWRAHSERLWPSQTAICPMAGGCTKVEEFRLHSSPGVLQPSTRTQFSRRSDAVGQGVAAAVPQSSYEEPCVRAEVDLGTRVIRAPGIRVARPLTKVLPLISPPDTPTRYTHPHNLQESPALLVQEGRAQEQPP